MSFTGTFVVARTDVPLWESPAVTERTEGFENVNHYADNWVVGRFDDDEIGIDADAFVQDMAGETGAPVLIGYLVQDVAVFVTGFADDTGLWFGFLDEQMCRLMTEADGLSVDDVYPGWNRAVANMAAWARAAGLEPDHQRLAQVFSTPVTHDVAAESLFDNELLIAAGLQLLD